MTANRSSKPYVRRCIREVLAHLAPLFCIPFAAPAQINPYEFSPDARFVAMGRVSVDSRSSASWLTNPAFGFQSDAYTAGFHTRQTDWFSGLEGGFRAFTASVPFSDRWGVSWFFAPYRERFGPGLPELKQDIYGFTGRVVVIPGRLTAGVSLKGWRISGGADMSATLFDAGVMGIVPLGGGEDPFALVKAGLSLENTGSDLTEGGIVLGRVQQWLHVTASCEARWGDMERDRLSVSLLAGVQWSRILNRWSGDWRTFGGGGIEAGVNDLVFLRVGSTADPYDSVFGERGKLSVPYGAGVRFPLRMISGNAPPIVLTADYARIPLRTALTGTDRPGTSVFSFSLEAGRDILR